MAVCSMLCTDGLLLHLVGKRQLLVYSGASYGNGKLGDSIWEIHHKSSAQGKHSSSGMQSILIESPMPFFYGLTHALWIVFLFLLSPSARNPHLHGLLVLLGNAQQAFLVCSRTVWRLSVFSQLRQ